MNNLLKLACTAGVMALAVSTNVSPTRAELVFQVEDCHCITDKCMKFYKDKCEAEKESRVNPLDQWCDADSDNKVTFEQSGPNDGDPVTQRCTCGAFDPKKPTNYEWKCDEKEKKDKRNSSLTSSSLPPLGLSDPFAP